jgi:hypothetical protein
MTYAHDDETKIKYKYWRYVPWYRCVVQWKSTDFSKEYLISIPMDEE